MNIIKYDDKFYKKIVIEDLSKEELLELINGVEEVPKIVTEYFDRPSFLNDQVVTNIPNFPDVQIKSLSDLI